MNYRCPKCSHPLKMRGLFFHDISTCTQCGQKVVLGDFFAFFLAAIAMLVSALSSLYILSLEIDQYFVAAGYAMTIGMVAGMVVMFLLGRAQPFRKVRIRPAAKPSQAAPLEGEAASAPKG